MRARLELRRTATAVALLAFVYVAVRLFWWADEQQSPASYSVTLSGLLKALLWVVPSALVAVGSRRRGADRPHPVMGLDVSALRGFGFGLVATLPLGVAVLLSGHARATLDVLAGTALLGPFAEEVLFRGFLLTQLRERARIPLPWALGVSALAFGLAHAPQLNAHIGSYHISSPWELALLHFGVVAGQVATLTAGGLVFAWVYWRTQSLWPAIGLHAFLNFWLTVSADPSRLVPTWSLSLVAVAQLVSFSLAIWLSLGRRHCAPGQYPRFGPSQRSACSTETPLRRA